MSGFPPPQKGTALSAREINHLPSRWTGWRGTQAWRGGGSEDVRAVRPPDALGRGLEPSLVWQLGRTRLS